MDKLLPSKINISGNGFVVFLKTDFKKSLLFVILLMIYLSAKLYRRLSANRFFPRILVQKASPKLRSLYSKSINRLDHQEENTVRRVSLIELALGNMRYKKSRTMITIGGMAVGIGAIVFLVSLGYGIQQLVISKVARLEELRQADVSPLPGGKFKIDDKAVASFKELQHVESVLPLITVVGRVNFNNSISDMAVYGVTQDYLNQSAIKPSYGKIFESNKLVKLVSSSQEVAGASTKAELASLGHEIGEIDYSINSGEWIRVRESPSTGGRILGYTKRTTTASKGIEVYGSRYSDESGLGEIASDEDGRRLGLWIKDEVLLWEEKDCGASSGDCEGGKYVVLREGSQQVKKRGYFAQLNISSSRGSGIEEAVLGVATESASTESEEATGETDELLALSEVATESAALITQDETKEITLSKEAEREAVVNIAMLKILGIKESQAVGEKFTVSFIATGDLVSNNKMVKSVPAEYTVVGVIPDDGAPIFYVPFLDLRSMGITNYSQVKIAVDDKDNLEITRKQISALGFSSLSVADTVSQINSLFSTIRTVLAMLGTIALVVAALGMFNTLTVSLLERTREVGLMKAMGMKSEEVRELFLTESMIMGFFGGILGLLVGFIAGKLVGVIISIFAIAKGQGFLDVSHIPLSFILFIIILSFFVGLITGIYPARRATKISALNALRYE